MEKLPILIPDIKRRYKDVPVLGIFCESIAASEQFDYTRLGMLNDFVCCPFNETDLMVRIRRISCSKVHQLDNSSSKQTDSCVEIPGLIGQSRAFQKATGLIPLLSRSDAPVLILGETGTGKELFARAIHYQSPSHDKPFIPVNCGAIPDHLFESEMFGHCKGAFTDAVMSQPGLLREAEGGTLFLDEVDTLSPSAQVKLLRFLQDGVFRAVGSSKYIQANVRILAATNRTLPNLVQQGHFREDLYFRLNCLSVEIPSLRERIEDIPMLAEYFLAKYTKPITASHECFTADGIRKLLAYDWPGNVRELENVIRRSVTLHPQASRLEATTIELAVNEGPVHANKHHFQYAKEQAVAQFERAYLLQVLAQHKGNISRAAKTAGKERRTFRRLLAKHRIERNEFVRSA